MQAVGRLGSYISKSVYTVSGPFHPFGGAVDIIVVAQPDGSYKSSPWYVRFGKFQGVLKTKEKLVQITVNGVEADFHMHLDSKGEAFFMKEVDSEEDVSAFSPPCSSGEDTDGQHGDRRPMKSKSCSDSSWSDSIDSGKNGSAIPRTNSRRSQILGLVFGNRRKGAETPQGEHEGNVVSTEAIDFAEYASDLMDLKWSTNLASSRCNRDNASRFSAEYVSNDVGKNLHSEGCTSDETILISHSSCTEIGRTGEENDSEMKCLTSKYIVEDANSDSLESVQGDNVLANTEQLTATGYFGMGKEGDCVNSVTAISAESLIPANDSSCCGRGKEVCVHSEIVRSMDDVKSEPERHMLSGQETSIILEYFGNGDQNTFFHVEKTSITEVAPCSTSERITTDAHSEVIHLQQSNGSIPEMESHNILAISGSGISSCTPAVEQTVLVKDKSSKHGSPVGSVCDPQIHDCIIPFDASSGISNGEPLLFGKLDGIVYRKTEYVELISGDNEEKKANSSFSAGVADQVIESSQSKCCSSFSADESINECKDDTNLQKRRLRTVSSEVTLNTNGLAKSKELTRTARSLPSMSPLSNGFDEHDLGHSLLASVKSDDPSTCVQSISEDVKNFKEGKDRPHYSSIGTPPRPIEGSQRSWPFSFKRSRSMNVSPPATVDSENPSATKISNINSDLEEAKDGTRVNTNKRIIRAGTPTSEQLASLNLKEGKNIVIFTFSTAMLGKQQVDARIFLWRWDSRVVISDVDGTITRSDLLGQVMPLVGMDWSQTGVAHFFSAIKENGYQFLFLSARSISQAFHTRQMLFSIKQDGKALPEGPVVISPDGLFPSLFREVVRRAPHEFKIACLEDIKALFPAGTNPFYAGFGNRDTDEFSYIKVGIPRSKIFIINPKGEIVVNRQVDTKSYSSLHTLVNDMFPSMMSSSEQEDFNSWNYWKLPPPSIDN